MWCSHCCSRRGNEDAVLDPSTSNPLQERRIDINLENKIAEWQRAIIECEALELKLMECEGDAAKYLIYEIRKHPRSYINNSSDLVTNIAKKHIHIQSIQSKLPMNMTVDSEKNDEDGGSSGRSRSSASGSTGWHENDHNSTASVTDKLSSIWSQRLNTVNHTQGVVDLLDSSNNKDLKIRPKWPDYLGDISFDIIKVNKYGHKMNRTLKLTQYHVISIRNGKEVTKFYRYEDIRRVWLQNGDTIKVIQRNDKKNMYVSPIAPHILQQIITRVQVRASLDRTNFNEHYQTLGYTSESTSQMIKLISEQNTQATEEVLANFATELKLKVMNTDSQSFGKNVFEEQLKEIIDQSESVEEEVKKTMEDILRKLGNSSQQSHHKHISTKPTTNQQPKFINFQEDSPEYSVQLVVRSLISDPSTPEGNTLKLFVSEFLAVNPTTSDIKEMCLKVRHFIDGMHEHLVTTRGFKLAVEYQQAKQRSLIKDKLDLRIKSMSKQARRASLNVLRDKSSLAHVDDELLTWISFIVFAVIEETIFLRIRDKLILKLRTDKIVEDEMCLLKKMKLFSERDQNSWGIPETFISPLGWRTAIFELSGLEHNLTPTSQLFILTRTVKAIYNEFQVAILPKLQEQGKFDTFIAADDLVPIFIYVLTQAILRHPVQNRDIMWGLCHPDQLHGESGYYLTIYESAIEYILQESDDTTQTVESPLKSLSNHSSRSASTDNQRLSAYLSQVIYPKFHDDPNQQTMRESFV